MKFREKILPSGTKIFLGKDAKNNDELMKEYKGKPNTILHTVFPGSPFCVIETKPLSGDVAISGSVVASYSQDWRNHKRDIEVNVFTGKDVKKRFWMKPGSWKVGNTKTIKIKKKDILNFERGVKRRR